MNNNILIIAYHKGEESSRMLLEFQPIVGGVFCYPFLLQPGKAKATVLATIALQTWLKSESDTGKVYIAHGLTG